MKTNKIVLVLIALLVFSNFAIAETLDNGSVITYQCSDDKDNDGDGKVDFPNDLGCTNVQDNSEYSDQYQCADFKDNDDDSLVDMADPGCISSTDNNEYNYVASASQCSDQKDNDDDSLVDMADPGCTSSTDNDEYNAPPVMNTTNTTLEPTTTETTTTTEPAAEEQPTNAEVVAATETATGTDIPPEVEQAMANESSNSASPVSALTKLLVIEKFVKKARTTRAYSANKKAAEPLLRDIEMQLAILKKLASNDIRTRVNELAKTKGVTIKRQGMLNRLFKTTGNFFAGMVTKEKLPLVSKPVARGMWITIENQLNHMKKASVFAKNAKAIVALEKIAQDVKKLKSLVPEEKGSDAVSKESLANKARVLKTKLDLLKREPSLKGNTKVLEQLNLLSKDLEVTYEPGHIEKIKVLEDKLDLLKREPSLKGNIRVLGQLNLLKTDLSSEGGDIEGLNADTLNDKSSSVGKKA